MLLNSCAASLKKLDFLNSTELKVCDPFDNKVWGSKDLLAGPELLCHSTVSVNF